MQARGRNPVKDAPSRFIDLRLPRCVLVKLPNEPLRAGRRRDRLLQLRLVLPSLRPRGQSPAAGGHNLSDGATHWTNKLQDQVGSSKARIQRLQPGSLAVTFGSGLGSQGCTRGSNAPARLELCSINHGSSSACKRRHVGANCPFLPPLGRDGFKRGAKAALSLLSRHSPRLQWTITRPG